jgi:hypothetical protein
MGKKSIAPFMGSNTIENERTGGDGCSIEKRPINTDDKRACFG